MKFKVLFILFSITQIFVGFGQTVPIGINYQAIARDTHGEELINSSIDIKFSIIKNGANGTLEWQESHTAHTNEFGLFTLIIGQGNRLDGTATSFDKINWGDGSHYLKVEAKFSNEYSVLGTTQMTAVPYAMYAEKAGNSSSGGIVNITYDPLTYSLSADGNVVANLSNIKTDAIQDLSLNGNLLSLSKSTSTTDLSKYIDRPNLSLSGNYLSITNGNTVTLPNSYLMLSHDTISLMQAGLNYGRVKFDTDSTNEIQHISRSGNYVLLDKTGGNVYDADTSKTNELITAASFDGDKVNIREAGIDHQIDISSLKNTPWVGFNCSYSSFGTLNMAANTELSIPWTKEFDDTNNFTNNQFIVPSSGVYYFSITIIFSTSSDNIDLNIYKSGSKIRSFQEIGTKSFNASLNLKLVAGDIIEIKAANRSGSSAYNINQAIFAGYRLH